MKRKYIALLALIVAINASSCASKDKKNIDLNKEITTEQELETEDLQESTEVLKEIIDNEVEVTVEGINENDNNNTIKEDSFNYEEQIQKIEEMLSTLTNEDILKLIDKTDIDYIMKDIVKNILLNSSGEEEKWHILELLVTENEKQNIAIAELMASANSSTLKNTYSKEEIKVLDNRSSFINIPDCMYLLKDASKYGDYTIYHLYDLHSILGGGVIDGIYIITDEDDHVVSYVVEYFAGEKRYVFYEMIYNNNINLIKFENVLSDNHLEVNSSLTNQDLDKLTFSISKNLNTNDASSECINAQNILVLNTEECENVFLASEMQDYYVFVPSTPYLFCESATIYEDINNESAYVYYSLGINGLQYKDFDKNIYISLNMNLGFNNSITTLNEFLIQKGFNELVKTAYTKEEIDEIMNNLKENKDSKRVQELK